MKPLTEASISEAKILRYEKSWSWYAVSKKIDCDTHYLRLAIDPNYSEYAKRRNERRNAARRARCAAARAERIKNRKPRDQHVPRETDVQALADKRAVQSDMAFIAAMRGAIRKGDETAVMITRKAPETDNPRFTPHRGMGQLSLTGSSASLCADFA